MPRILRIMDLTFPELEADYQRDPSLAHLPFVQQRERFRARRGMYFNNFADEMARLGWETHDIAHNVAPMQRAWARDHGVAVIPQGDHQHHQILLAQIEAIKPDVLWLQATGAIPHYLRARLKQMFPFLRKVLMIRGHLENRAYLVGVDQLFAGVPCLADYYREVVPNTRLVYHSFDTSILDLLDHDDPEPADDLIFAGSSGYGMGTILQSRYWFLRALAPRIPLTLYLKERLTVRDQIEATHYPPGFERMRLLGELFPDQVRPPVFGLDMYQLLARSGITLHKHTDFTRGQVGAMRLFECTGVGGCLVTDDGENLGDLFERDTEVVTYSSTEECIEKINWLLDNPKQRKEIAAAGQRRCLRDHNLRNRCEVMDAALRHGL